MVTADCIAIVCIVPMLLIGGLFLYAIMAAASRADERAGYD